MKNSFTLIETLIALTLLFLAALAIFSLHSTTLAAFERQQRSERSYMTASVVATFDDNLTQKRASHPKELLRKSGIDIEPIRKALPDRVEISIIGESPVILENNTTITIYTLRLYSQKASALLYGVRQ